MNLSAYTTELEHFFSRITADARISARHVSLYTSLWILWKQKGKSFRLHVFSHEVRTLCKISSASTYHKTIRQLHEFGYIYYIPSFDRFTESVVEFGGRNGP